MTHQYGETRSNVDDHAVFGNELLVCEILSRLPLESLQTCKCVCRSWQSLIHKNPCFMNLHVNRLRANNSMNSGLLFLIGSWGERNLQLFYGKYEDIRRRSSLDAEFSYKKLSKIKHPFINKRPYERIDNIIGSCNGLVCFFIPHNRVNDPVYICNPITREYANLPRLSYEGGIVVSGFGYHPLSNKYKVVRIYCPGRYTYSRPATKGCVEVYTLGSGTGWRNIGEITYTFSRSGILANGSLYWFDDEQYKIVVFDLGDEEFKFLPTVPQCFPGSKRAQYQLKELGGDLCLLHIELGNRVDIWSYKLRSHHNTEEGFQCWSWSLDLSIACPAYSYSDRLILTFEYLYVPFALTENDEVLLWLNGSGLFCYDKKADTLRQIVGEDESLIICQGIPHMNSLVSLRALGERSKTRKVIKKIRTKKMERRKDNRLLKILHSLNKLISSSCFR